MFTLGLMNIHQLISIPRTNLTWVCSPSPPCTAFNFDEILVTSIHVCSALISIEMMFTVSIPLSGHIFTLVTCNRIFISWYFDGHQIYFSKVMCWIMLTNGPIFVVMTKQILCCIVFMEISSLFRATKIVTLTLQCCHSSAEQCLSGISDGYHDFDWYCSGIYELKSLGSVWTPDNFKRL